MSIKEVYNVSLCKNGLLGGLLYVKETEIVYCTNKLTVPESIRRLHMAYSDIESVTEAPLRTVLVKLKNGQQYRFFVFSRNRLLQRIKDKL